MRGSENPSRLETLNDSRKIRSGGDGAARLVILLYLEDQAD